MADAGRFEVEVVRGDVVESRHTVNLVVATGEGPVQSWGDPDRPTIARSAIKSIQALPLVTTGAADAFDVTEEELALACASHSGEPAHVEAVAAWLDRIGLSEADLECGPRAPIDAAAKEAMYARGDRPSPLTNGCSGKHAGFLTIARYRGWPTAGYVEPTSPVQRLVTAAVATMTGFDLTDVSPGLDGCGIPVHAIPIERLAVGIARLVAPAGLDSELAAAAGRVSAAARRAFWVSGTGRTEVVVCDAATEPVVIKTGAEGVFMAGLPDRGLGLALKVEDGNQRASRVAVRAALGRLGVIGPEVAGPAEVRTSAGRLAGQVRAVIGPPNDRVPGPIGDS